MESNIIYPEESYKIMGACFNVYKDKGPGFLEAVYHECLAIEFEYQGIPFVEEQEIRLKYRERVLDKKYRADFVCYDKILVEIKAVSNIIDEYRSIVINYLNATEFKLCLLVNFGHYPKLEYKRFVLTETGNAKRELN